jgi:hypothetical protein
MFQALDQFEVEKLGEKYDADRPRTRSRATAMAAGHRTDTGYGVRPTPTRDVPARVITRAALSPTPSKHPSSLTSSSATSEGPALRR